MHETYQLASVIYKKFMENPLSEELCDCVTDDEVNGVMDELSNIAQQLRSKEINGKGRAKTFRYAGGYQPGGDRGDWSRWTPWSSTSRPSTPRTSTISPWTSWSSWTPCPSWKRCPVPVPSWGGEQFEFALVQRRKRGTNNENYENLQQAYLEYSNKETAFNLISFGNWTPGTLKGRKQWVNYAAMLTYSMINKQEIKNFATFLFCKLSA